MLPDGNYQKVDKRGKVLLEAQKEFCKEALSRKQRQPVASRRRFEPGMAPDQEDKE